MFGFAEYKVVITGPFNSGKTTFIGTASDIEAVRTEKKITTEDRDIKAETTVAMDYGRTYIEGRTLHLHGTPGQSRFRFMWEILSEDLNAFVVMIDSTDRHALPDALEIIQVFTAAHPVPYLIAANKSDAPSPLSLADIRQGLALPPGVEIIPCIATVRSRTKQVLGQVIRLIEGS